MYPPKNSRVKRPTIEGGASIDAVLAWPSLTPRELRGVQLFKNWSSEQEQYEFFSRHIKSSMIESISDLELSIMLQGKRSDLWNAEEELSKDVKGMSETQWLIHKDVIYSYPLFQKCMSTLEGEIRNRAQPENKQAETDIPKLKNEVDIVSLVESYVGNIRYKPGQLIKCPLPKHKDGTASMSINRKKGVYKCFGCNSGGDHISFIQEMTGCDFRTAILALKNFH